jgi:hypothetical protein
MNVPQVVKKDLELMRELIEGFRKEPKGDARKE